MSGGGETDVGTKYQKLATEYAKLRSQVTVLKKGVLDEQEKCAVLSDQLNDRETQLRKQESEMEGILFRNQQLTRRVNVLQEEIDTLNSKPKSKWKLGGSNVPEDKPDFTAARVINEELAAKITENARLHATLDDIEKQYESTILSLQNRIQELEKEKNQLGLDKRNHESETSDNIQYYTRENDELKNEIIVLRRDLGVRTKQAEGLEVQVSVLLDKEKNRENVKRIDFSSQFEYIDPDLVKARQNMERDVQAMTIRLSECCEQLSSAEKDREHWKLESQLANIKLNKLNQGNVEELNSEENTLCSQQIKKAFETRLAELIKQKIAADSKATVFYLECQALNYKVENFIQQVQSKEESLNDVNMLMSRKEEEWNTMQTNYEEQLSVISDHLATMNTRLAGQEDEIQLLRQEAANNKVETASEQKKNKSIKSLWYSDADSNKDH